MAKNTKFVLTINLVIFFIIFLLHVLRLIFGWDAQVGSLVIPVWFSGVFVVLAAILVYLNYKAL